jgi:xanthine/uracil permease
MINMFSMIAAAALLICAVVDLRRQNFIRATLLAVAAGANLIFVASSL